MTCLKLYYVHITLSLYYIFNSKEVHRVRVGSLAKITNNRERLFDIEEDFLSLSTLSLTLENKEKLSWGQNGGNFRRKKTVNFVFFC